MGEVRRSASCAKQTSVAETGSGQRLLTRQSFADGDSLTQMQAENWK